MTKLMKASIRETEVPGEFDVYLEDEDWMYLATKSNSNRIVGILRLKYEEPVKITHK